MKKSAIIVIVVLSFLFVIALLGGVLKMISFRNKTIEGITRIHFSYSVGNYMDGSIDYELLCDDECKLYYKGNRIPIEKRKEYAFDKNTVREIEEKLNSYRVSQWDGFRGGNKFVLDGDSFSLYIQYKDGKSIDAHGYENWPKNYSDVKNYLIQVFSEVIPEEDQSR